MHSSRMRTDHSLTVSVCRSLGVWSGGVCSGVSGLGGCLLGRCLVRGVCSWGCLLLGVSGLGGVWSRGVSGPGGGGLLWGGVFSGGVSGPGGVCSGGVSGPGGSALEGCLLWGVSGPGGAVWVSQHALRQTPPVNRMTDACQNITLAQLRCGR